jgi:O-acetyl-ADP-ribose deacetylase (regulator of RNase III)
LEAPISIGEKISFVQGDITDQETDVIVNAANSSLMGGGGVDGAIHRKGGLKILEECRLIRTKEWPDGLPTGKAVVTSGGNLKANYVIHTVGPIWFGGNRGEPELLADAYRNSLILTVKKGLKSISFPSISTGAYGYPIEKASEVAINVVKQFLEEEKALSMVVFVLYSQHDFQVYLESARKILGQNFQHW